tara:strand:+ start:6644 stop:9319 length:2676 start_codon:yes stop_codon:yes gene_type:complete
MSYVDAFYEQGKDIVTVIERVDGKRVIKEIQPAHNFYYADPKGKHKSIYGDAVTEVRCSNIKDLKKNIGINNNNKLFESDIRPLNKVLAEQYIGADVPDLNVAFFDIEVDFDPLRGYSSPSDPFTPITAIGVYMQWMDAMICLAVPPKTLTWEQAQEVVKPLPEVMLFRTEKEMLNTFLDIIDDADVLSGWNSEGYDIPYTMNRIIKTLGKAETRRMCLLKKLPKERKYEKFGNEVSTYDLVGRIHLDYLELYRKYNYEERHSYRLDYIGEMEVGEKKVPYEGSLDRLYNHDFLKFCEYNIQDVMLLDKMDKKLQFIDLANIIAHENTVLIPTTMGAVATTEQAIINESHRRGMVVPDKPRASDRDSAAGAFVANPKKGFHEWVGSMDLNSLYPSVFRALNMAPETIVGQLDPSYTLEEVTNAQILEKKSFADAWHGKFGTNEYEFVKNKDVNHVMKLEMEDGSSHEVTGADVYNLVFNSGQPWNISANGTIFTTDVQGIVPGLLELWYTDRQKMQKKKKETSGAEQTYWDKRQLVKKIQLNSLYGAILNPHCRFYDKRIGQSTTLTGRAITKHMAAETNKMLTGEYDYEGKCIIYGDTDSVYFTAVPVMGEEKLDMDSAIKLYDYVSDTVSSTFPKFLKDSFNVPESSGAVMIAGREVVGRAGLFLTKKRYGILCLDIEGYQPEGGKLKAMGLEIKRSDTPEFIQDFLEELLTDCLNSLGEDHALEKIKEFKKYFKELEPWAKGMPKRVNNMTMYTARLLEKARAPDTNRLHKLTSLKNEVQSNMIPGHVRAGINWNNLKKANSDAYSLTITDGAKVVVCKLRNNPMGYTSVAYPTDELNLPQWFKDLPFDEEAMEEAVLDKKIANVIGPMGFDLSRTTQSESFTTFFEF